MRLFLLRGSWIAGAGALMIIIAGTFLPVKFLTLWGIPIFFAGIFLIALGLLPYRRLAKLEIKPHTLTYDGEFYIFAKQGKPLFKISEKSIQKMIYVEKGNVYGIAIWLQRPLVERVKVLQPHFNFATFAAESAERYEGCDLFLPYFSEKSLRLLA